MPIDILVWLVLVIAFAVIEAATAQLTTIWFAVGSLVALIAASVGADLWLQIVLCIVVSVLVLVFIRPLVKKLLIPIKSATNADMVIGKTASVTEEINNIDGKGEIRVGGLAWSARSEDGSVIHIGELVEVLRIEGVKLYVRRAAVAENKED
ncbi:MAG: NfeD family protein [Oscillospiraceae bacterium]|nr:NfeD family protein [Oscillospiraceae bacterium]